MGQEHWLPEKRLSDLSQLNVNFTARSGMETAFSQGIYNGRPHGGVSIAWSPDLDHLIKPLVNYKHKRIVCIELAADPHPLLFASIYMPFFDSSKRQECIAETVECIAMLEEIIIDHPSHKLIIGGDLNTELRDKLPFDRHWKEFLQKYDLVCCDEFVNNSSSGTLVPNYTYHHESLDQRKWNDHFLLSKSLLPSTNCHEILDCGDNPSDHLPISFHISAVMPTEPPTAAPSIKPPSLKWEKCTGEQKANYKNRLALLLQQSPSVLSSCNTFHKSM